MVFHTFHKANFEDLNMNSKGHDVPGSANIDDFFKESIEMNITKALCKKKKLSSVYKYVFIHHMYEQVLM
jgi:hypothetical protein